MGSVTTGISVLGTKKKAVTLTECGNGIIEI